MLTKKMLVMLSLIGSSELQLNAVDTSGCADPSNPIDINSKMFNLDTYTTGEGIPAAKGKTFGVTNKSHESILPNLSKCLWIGRADVPVEVKTRFYELRAGIRDYADGKEEGNFSGANGWDMKKDYLQIFCGKQDDADVGVALTNLRNDVIGGNYISKIVFSGITTKNAYINLQSIDGNRKKTTSPYIDAEHALSVGIPAFSEELSNSVIFSNPYPDTLYIKLYAIGLENNDIDPSGDYLRRILFDNDASQGSIIVNGKVLQTGNRLHEIRKQAPFEVIEDDDNEEEWVPQYGAGQLKPEVKTKRSELI